MIDFHSHILPEMDDGSESVETSIKLLECLEKQKVDTLCLTSHYYPEMEEIDEYIKRRDASFNKLVNSYSGGIKLIKGSEVYCYRGISLNSELEKLCLQGSDLLLLELPWDRKFDFKELYNLNNRLSVVLAHIERYFDIYNTSDFKELAKRGIYLQCNCEVFSDDGFRLIKDLFEGGYISFIGSDSHNLDTRKPEFDKFESFLVEKYSKEYYDIYVKDLDRIFFGCFK